MITLILIMITLIVIAVIILEIFSIYEDTLMWAHLWTPSSKKITVHPVTSATFAAICRLVVDKPSINDVTS